MSKQYNIKINNMWISTIFVDEQYAKNDFITGISFTAGESEEKFIVCEEDKEALQEKIENILGLSNDRYVLPVEFIEVR